MTSDVRYICGSWASYFVKCHKHRL